MILFPKLASLKNVQWHIISTESNHNSPQPWSGVLIEKISAWSTFLLSKSEVKRSSEIVALAFWCRKANLISIIKHINKYDKIDITKRQPIGRVFHITPANVDTVFFYSLVLSLLSGNQNIVRVSSKSGEITWQIIRLFREFINQAKNKQLASLVSIVEYDASNEIATKAFSAWADLRVVWGGDNAIEAISHIAPHINQLVFPDRYSVSLIKLSTLENSQKTEEMITGVAERFITDLLPFNQQACSSPKTLYWLNTDKILQTLFWKSVHVLLASIDNPFEAADEVARYVFMQRLAIKFQTNFECISNQVGISNILISGLSVDALSEHRGHGLVFEVEIDSLNLLPYADKLQTVGVFGLNENELTQLKIKKENDLIKRDVSLGKALSFDHVWDGKHLPFILTKAEKESQNDNNH